MARSYTATATAVNVITAGFLAICAAAVVTAGTAIPACLVAGLASVLAIGLGLNNDMATNTVQVSSGNPDPARRDVVQWYREHDNGWLEDYTGRIPELRLANESSVTVVDAISGFRHYVEKKPDNSGFKIRTNLRQGTKTRRQAESPGGWTRVFPALVARSTPPSLSSAIIDTQQLIDDATYASSATAYSDAASDILQVAASGLGTYCVTVSSSAGEPADIGLTLNGGGTTVSNSEPPCKASTRMKKRGI